MMLVKMSVEEIVVFLTPRERMLYILEQSKEIHGQPHCYFTGCHVGHSPTEVELLRHWLETGASKRWAELFIQRHQKIARRIKRLCAF